MTVLVTGARGYLGSQLIRELRCVENHFIGTSRRGAVDLVCDLNKSLQVADLIKYVNPSAVIHCASFVPKNTDEYDDSLLCSQNIAILENIVRYTSCPIYFISSMAVYGDSDVSIRFEKDARDPLSIYGKSKLLCEEFLEACKRDSFCVRIPGLFGGDRKSGLVYGVIKSLKNNLVPQLPSMPVLWAGLDVEDAARSIVKLLQFKPTGYSPINLGYPGVYSINLFLEYCEDFYETKIDTNIVHPEFEFDLSLAKKYGIVPGRTFKEKIKCLVRNECGN